MDVERAWQVLLLGGASGVGKSSVSYWLARHYDVGLIEVDDFQVVLEGMTTPEQYPVLHYWHTHFDEARRMSEEEQLDFFLQYSQVMARTLTLVIANHIESRAPIVLEGDFILPSLAVQTAYGDIPASGQVRAVFLHEEDQEQIGRNYFQRDGMEQPERARTSWRVSRWLKEEAERLDVPAVSARPWASVLQRTIRAIDFETRDPGPGFSR